MSTAALETYVDLSRTRLETMLKVLDVDGAVERTRGGWTATGQEWDYDQERYDRVAAARRDEQSAMLAYIATDGCRMRFLREQLDDPEAADCGRCDNCGGLELPVEVSGAAVEEAGERLRRPGVTLAPRKMWPTALANLGIDLKGTDRRGRGRGTCRRPAHRPRPRAGAACPVPAGRARTGRCPGRWSTPSSRCSATGTTSWPARPTGVAYVESARRPQLTRDLADGLARYLRLPLVARWQIVDPDVAPGQGSANSAQRVAAVGRRFDLAVDQPLDGGPVLLVDDLVATGWTVTLAARALRAAGAGAVLPLTLGVETLADGRLREGAGC